MRKDIEIVLKKFNINTFGNKKNIEAIEDKLLQDEEVFYLAPTKAVINNFITRKKETMNGIIAITDKRIVCSFKVGFSDSMEIIPLSDIKSFNCRGDSLSNSHIEINSTTKSYDFLASYKKEVRDEIQNIINVLLQNYNKPQITYVNSTNEYAQDSVTQIEKFFELKEKGIITEEEFNEKKKQLLSIDKEGIPQKNEIKHTNITQPVTTQMVSELNNRTLRKSKVGCGSTIFIIIISLLFSFVLILVGIYSSISIMSNGGKQSSSTDINKENNINDKTIFDTKAFIVDGKRTVTEEELIKKIGQPDKVDNWDYTSATGDKYPIKTLIYGKYEYKFNDGYLKRITILEPIAYKYKSDFLEMFNVTKNAQSKLKDTGAAYRLTDGSIHDFWVGYDDKTKKTEWIHISYSDLFD